LKIAIEKLTLNDANVSVQKESSDALGTGFRCGFSGVLHMEVWIQRIEQEHGISVIATAPTVTYQIEWKDGTTQSIVNSSQYVNVQQIVKTLEPIVIATIITPDKYIGSILNLCQVNHVL